MKKQKPQTKKKTKTVKGWAVMQSFSDWNDPYIWSARNTRLLAEQYKQDNFDKKSAKGIKVLKCTIHYEL